MEVEVREEIGPPPDSTALLVNNTPSYPVEDKPELIVRAEEVIIVVLFLMIWVAAIALFFNRWGQIRTLEPYQPKFQQNHHRTSCPLAPLSPPHITPQVSSIPLRTQNSISQRMSFSKYNVNCFSDNFYTGVTSPNMPRRARLNSVFVGSSTMAVMSTPPRRAKSAMDIQHLIVNEKCKRPSLIGFNSLMPITNSRERRPSISIDRAPYHSRHRKSMAFDRPMLSHYHHPRSRRMSCFVDRRHKNFISFDQSERKSSSTIDKSTSSTQPVVSFDTTPSVSFDQPTVIVEHAEINHVPASKPCSTSPKISRSFEQPRRIELIPPRISTSLDVHTPNTDRIPIETNCVKVDNSTAHIDVNASSFDKSSSISEEGSESVIISFSEAQITAPLFEGLKSSDV